MFNIRVFLQLVGVTTDFLVGHVVVCQIVGEIAVVGSHVDEAVARQVEKNGLFLAFDFGFESLIDCGSNSVRRLRSGNNAFGAGEKRRSLECVELLDINSLKKSVMLELADDCAAAVIAKSAGVDICR